eukprot:11387810-Alexandrium_andersonii.AAC.1
MCIRDRAYWVSLAGDLLLVAPEHLRLAARVEQTLPGAVANLMQNVTEELRAEGGIVACEDLAGVGPEAPRIEVAPVASSAPPSRSAVPAAAEPAPVAP